MSLLHRQIFMNGRFAAIGFTVYLKKTISMQTTIYSLQSFIQNMTGVLVLAFLSA